MPVAKKSENRYKIMHTQVGPWPVGRVVTEAELLERTKDIGRLLNLGAIKKTAGPVTKEPVPVGPHNEDGGVEETNTPLDAEGKKNSIIREEGEEPVADETGDETEEVAGDETEEPVNEEEEVIDEGGETQPDPSDLSLPQLRVRARALKIKNFEKMTRDQLVTAIGDAQAV
jgi:hypothetical protein